MITEKIRKAIAQRATVNDEWDYGVQQSQKAILSIISESPDDTIHFIENECTLPGSHTDGYSRVHLHRCFLPGSGKYPLS